MLHVNFTPFPVITTERLLLRPTIAADAGELYYLRTNEEVMRHIDRPRPKSEEDILLLIEKIQKMAADNEGISWAMSFKDDPKFIGTISYHRLIKEHYRAEVGYMLHPEHCGKGIMSEALEAVLAYGFNTLGLHSIEAHLSPENTASAKLLSRSGFVQEGLFRGNHCRNGVFVDTAVYCRLRADRVA